MSSMNFTCDSCGREAFGFIFVNGMKFCAKCYQETFGETDKDRKIADLEAKLAESESKRKSLEEKVKFLTEETEENFVDGQKYNELKQQLAEKDKEIEYQESMKILAVKNQNQKAIEQLEKVNEVLTDTIIEVTENEFNTDKLCYLEEISSRFYDKIQQQINELKENNNGTKIC